MSFLSLSHIPCPAGNSCTAFKCLFGHDRDARISSSSSKAADDEESPREASKRNVPPATEPPRKRQRTERDDASSSSSATPVLSSNSDPGAAHTTLDGKPSTHSRPVSPPPLRRTTAPSSVTGQEETEGKGKQTAPPIAASSTSLTNRPTHKAPAHSGPTSASTPARGNRAPSPGRAGSSATTSTASIPKPTSDLVTQKSNKRKAESLNPRFLKSSPAAYDIRLKLLKLLHEQFTRLNREVKKALKDGTSDPEDKALVLSDQGVIWKALDAEEKAATDKPSIYSNIVRNLIMQYKRMAAKQWRDERRAELERHIRERNNGQKPAPKKIITGLHPQQEVKLLGRLLTPICNLSAHGYVSSVPDDADVEKARAGVEAADGWEKCDRCIQRFQVFPGRRDGDGALTSGSCCTYHWGKTYIPERAVGDKAKVPKRYRCCGEAVGDSAGCTKAENHVFKATDPKRLAAVFQYAETPPNPNVPSDRAVCFDCEMCYTTNGLELVRLTATSWPGGEILLDVLVQPMGDILDLNSRFSGVWPEDMTQAVPWNDHDSSQLETQNLPNPVSTDKKGDKTKSPPAEAKEPMKIVASAEVARDLLFSMIAPETPLIGHGLENDLNAVRIVHPTLVDTVLLHPHKHGLPFRYGLKMLMESRLHRMIQVETGGKVQGHDSAEDARAAGELVLLKVKEAWDEMKYDGWKLDEKTGDFVDPPSLVPATAEIDPPGKLTAEFLEAAH